MRKDAGKKAFILLVAAVVLIVAGCGSGKPFSYAVVMESTEEEQADEERGDEGGAKESRDRENREGQRGEEDIADIYYDIYGEAIRADTADSPEMMRKFIEELGRAGYTAVDCGNQMNMVNPEAMIQFCQAVEDGRTEEAAVAVPDYKGGILLYELKTEKGEVEVAREYAQYGNGKLEKKSRAVYRAEEWRYTEDGYLFFGGSFYTAESYVLVMDDEPEHAALRVAPLDEACRELNRKYILPVGYRQNNLFLTDWSEEDFADVCFYDAFDVLYERANGFASPYGMDRNPNMGVVYHIPEQEFENVIMRYFRMNEEELRLRTAYLPEEKAYEYRPRGFYELGYSDFPYPEVVSYEEKKDGTIELTVNAVFPYEYTDKAYSHKVIIRPFADGRFQYVSNQIQPPGYYDIWWYSERLTKKGWEELYGEGEIRR